jgi:hypothetical protein
MSNVVEGNLDLGVERNSRSGRAAQAKVCCIVDLDLLVKQGHSDTSLAHNEWLVVLIDDS